MSADLLKPSPEQIYEAAIQKEITDWNRAEAIKRLTAKEGA